MVCAPLVFAGQALCFFGADYAVCAGVGWAGFVWSGAREVVVVVDVDGLR